MCGQNIDKGNAASIQHHSTPKQLPWSANLTWLALAMCGPIRLSSGFSQILVRMKLDSGSPSTTAARSSRMLYGHTRDERSNELQEVSQSELSSFASCCFE